MTRRRERSHSEWVTVASFSQPIEAHLARTKLESEGIPCVVGDENLVRVDWLLSNAVGGVKLKVPPYVADQARDVLRPRPHLVMVAADDEPSDGEMICPRCRSYDVYYQRFSQRLAGVFILLFGFLVPWRDRRWSCKQCGYEWKERKAP
ncbi:MAG TPA: DUF2007 domain-containing protein [Candidatus Krumholzibacteria bacterium]|nr:DUF2007 domain-containing protein [Candidatus Krumholzibacteria bacterium]